jgi:predicted nucleic-acid-binding protein
MIALDTNVVVRLITRDDPAQVARARAMILERGALVQMTVLVETEWVLRSSYGYGRGAIASALALLSETGSLSVEDASAFPAILDAYRRGMDFADAVHLAGSRGADAFATFDRALIAGARRHFPERSVVAP